MKMMTTEPRQRKVKTIRSYQRSKMMRPKKKMKLRAKELQETMMTKR